MIRCIALSAHLVVTVLSASGCTREAAPAADGTTTRIWLGEGVLFDGDGEPAGEYDVRLEQRPAGADALEQIVEIRLPDGRTKHFTQRLQQHGRHLQIDSPDARGGGLELGDGMMQTHVETGEGRAQAQTIAMDGDERMRIVRVELEDGRAVRFFRESYRLQTGAAQAD